MIFPKPPDPSTTRATLLLCLKSDAPAREIAWREFYEQYAPIIGGFASKMGVKRCDVADLVHDVLVGFFSVSSEFNYDPGRGRFRGYLKTCTWRMVQRRFGKQLRIGGRSLDSVDPGELQVEAAWNDIWESEKLQRAMDLVRDRYLSREDRARTYRAFEMYVLLERPADEVACDLGMDVQGVHQAKTRISKAIRAALDEVEDAVG